MASQRRKTDKAARAAEASGGNAGAEVLKFPARKACEYVSRADMERLFSEAGITIDPGFLRIAKMPGALTRGMEGPLEFFDTLSVQPLPYRPEDSPDWCYRQGKPAPGWVHSKYLGLAREDGRQYLIFIDVQKKVFAKAEASSQGDLSESIMSAMMRQAGL